MDGDSTIDIDLTMEPESDDLLRTVPRLKESLSLNVELASPDHFIPALAGWRERSPFIAREGNVTFRHYDLYAQALSKIERGHDRISATSGGCWATVWSTVPSCCAASSGRSWISSDAGGSRGSRASPMRRPDVLRVRS